MLGVCKIRARLKLGKDVSQQLLVPNFYRIEEAAAKTAPAAPAANAAAAPAAIAAAAFCTAVASSSADGTSSMRKRRSQILKMLQFCSCGTAAGRRS